MKTENGGNSVKYEKKILSVTLPAYLPETSF